MDCVALNRRAEEIESLFSENGISSGEVFADLQHGMVCAVIDGDRKRDHIHGNELVMDAFGKDHLTVSEKEVSDEQDEDAESYTSVHQYFFSNLG